MKYIKILNIITESLSSKDLRNKYIDIPNNIFIQLIKCDPKTLVSKNPQTGKYSIDRLGKFAESMCKIYKNIEESDKKYNFQDQDKELETFVEDLPKAKEYIEIIYKRNLNNKINIENINNINDLFEIIKKYLTINSSILELLLKNIELEKDYLIDQETEEYYIYYPISEKGAAILSSGTLWCTGWGKYSTNPKYKDRKNYFHDYYNNKKNLIILINKLDNGIKYMLSTTRYQFKNKYDKDSNIEIVKSIFPYFYNNYRIIYDGKILWEKITSNLITYNKEEKNKSINKIDSSTLYISDIESEQIKEIFNTTLILLNQKLGFELPKNSPLKNKEYISIYVKFGLDNYNYMDVGSFFSRKVETPDIEFKFLKKNNYFALRTIFQEGTHIWWFRFNQIKDIKEFIQKIFLN